MARLLFGERDGVQDGPGRPALQEVPCNPALLSLACSRRVLLLQGPVGPFFDRLTRWLMGSGATVHRVVFQPGDARDCTSVRPIAFTGTPRDWPAFLDKLLQDLAIDAVVLFGQARKHHAVAVRAAHVRGIAAIVLEEGYVRPGYVTMELDGVNAYSRTLDRFAWSPTATAAPRITVAKPASTQGQFWNMAGYACRHYWHQYWGRPLSVEYQHHRPTDIWFHSAYWVRSWIRKHAHLWQDNAKVRALRDQHYYFVPLQHDGDSQITHHSPYPQNTAFIDEVLASFTRAAPAGSKLVFKTHPHSRGGPAYHRSIAQAGRRLGIGSRVEHLFEGHTPTLVQNARGVVLINSTVGVQAIARRKPLAVLGHANYKRPGLHFEGTLDDFWSRGQPPDNAHATLFLEQLVALTQAPCNVYGRASEPLDWHLSPMTPAVQGRP